MAYSRLSITVTLANLRADSDLINKVLIVIVGKKMTATNLATKETIYLEYALPVQIKRPENLHLVSFFFLHKNKLELKRQ